MPTEAIKKLPYIVAPQEEVLVDLGDTVTGIIKLPRYDDITPNEKTFVDNNMKNLPVVNKFLIKLVDNISKNTGKTKEEIWQLVQENKVVDLMFSDMEGFMELRQVQDEVSAIEKVIKASAILIYRCPACKDWTIKDVSDSSLVHPKMLRYLEEFYNKEQNGWDFYEKQGYQPSEEELKKISPVPDKERK